MDLSSLAPSVPSMPLSKEWSLPKARHRRPVTKSSTGCRECRRRKIKCDETKPSCLQCCQKGLSCPGSAEAGKPLGLRWSAKHEVFHDNANRRVRMKKSHELEKRGSVSSSSLLRESRSRYDSVRGVFDYTNSTTAFADAPIDWTSGQLLQHDRSMTENETVFRALNRPELYTISSEIHVSTSPDSSPVSEQPPRQTVFVEHAQQECKKTFPQRRQSSSLALTTTNSYNTAVIPIPEQIHDLQSTLIQHYFTNVCNIFSIFDSPQNPFRSFIQRRWQTSLPMLNTMLSMSAAKLAHFFPSMKCIGLHYQVAAIQSLHAQLRENTSSFTLESMFTILMLGLSTCWHDPKDFGFAHFRAVDNAIQYRMLDASMCAENGYDIEFFHQALVYWKMALGAVMDDFAIDNNNSSSSLSLVQRHQPLERMQPSTSRIRPHPWTGVASAPLALFARTCQCARQLRLYQRQPTISRSNLATASALLSEMEQLEEQVWHLKLPTLYEIDDVGDENTPPLHHLLLAEAYTFAALYQVYYLFPDVLDKRLLWIATESEGSPRNYITASWIAWLRGLLKQDGERRRRSQVLRYFGSGIVIRLEQIGLNSGTSCIQPLLLLVGAGGLTDKDLSQDDSNDAIGSDDKTRSRRQFILDRLDHFEKLSMRVDNVTTVIKEMFCLIDEGQEVFWMDVLYSLKLETVIGSCRAGVQVSEEF